LLKRLFAFCASLASAAGVYRDPVIRSLTYRDAGQRTYLPRSKRQRFLERRAPICTAREIRLRIPAVPPRCPAGIKLAGFSNQQFVNGVFGNPGLTFYGPTFESRSSAAIQVFCPNGLNSILDFGPVFSGPDQQCIPVGSDGNMGRNIFRGPAFKDVDLGLFKNAKVNERVNLQFRAEAFNLFNRVNLYNPIGNMGSPQFGQSVSAFPGRELQLGLKLLF
jgi:hypothetical protein